MARKVLIIEDDKDIARLVEMHLHEAGYEVSAARDGAAGLRSFIRCIGNLLFIG